jgi:WhiB family redox-sensing transcriptional regulator
MAGAGRGPFREIALAHLAQHPDLTAYELGNATGAKGSLTTLLRGMERQGLVVATVVRRPGQGCPVSEWRIAPPGTAAASAAPEPPEKTEARRARQRAYQRTRLRRIAAAVSAPFLPGAACRAVPDPDIFFPEAGDHEAEALAMALCAGCPARAACYAAAEANRERHGVWGGVNFDRVNGRRKAS